MIAKEVYLFIISSPRMSIEFAWFDGNGYWRVVSMPRTTERLYYANVKTLEQYKTEIMGSRTYTYRNVAKKLKLKGISRIEDFETLQLKGL